MTESYCSINNTFTANKRITVNTSLTRSPAYSYFTIYKQDWYYIYRITQQSTVQPRSLAAYRAVLHDSTIKIADYSL